MITASPRMVPSSTTVRSNRGEPLVSVKNLYVTFGSGRKRFEAVKGVSFDIYKGETFGLAGESGSGKTTIGRAIIRVNPISSGEVKFRGEQISGKVARNTDLNVIRNIQMIFQDPMASLNERAKVDYIVAEGLTNLNRKLSREARREAVHKALLDVGLLPEFSSRFPHEFSGGQRQRIGIARALIMNPSFIIADEPISALDVSIRAQVLNLMSALKRDRGLTYLFIAHDLSVMRFVTDRIAVIRNGRIVELCDTQRLFTNPLHPYTRALISAAPVPNPVVEKNKRLEVYNPNMHDYTKQQPEMVEIEPGHWVYGSAPEIIIYRKRLERTII